MKNILMSDDLRPAAAAVAMVTKDTKYFRETLESRISGSSTVGSVTFFDDALKLAAAIFNANWKILEHPALTPDCTGFITHDIPGKLGVVELSHLTKGWGITLSARKGKIEATIKLPRDGEDPRTEVNFSVMITGEEDGEELMFTFHPGYPVPSANVTDMSLDGKVVTPQEAMALGFTHAKWAE